MPTVTASLEREIGLVSRFLEILSTEQDALKQGNPTALPALGEEKAELIAQLNHAEDERNRLTGATSGTASRNAMTLWLDNSPQAVQCRPLWNKLLQLAQEAKLMHELNGQLLALHLRKTGEALAILSRQTQENSIYGADGQTSSRTGSRIVDSA